MNRKRAKDAKILSLGVTVILSVQQKRERR
jgi:hypothetical protein